MYKLHLQCRACGDGQPPPPDYIKSVQTRSRLVPVFDLGLQPLANSFCRQDDVHPGHAPLSVLLCPDCQLAQLSVVVDPAILYHHYAYVTAKNPAMTEHFDLLWGEINRECKPESVVEIGSNDGDFLLYAKQHGAEATFGIDPAENLAKVATERGARTVCSVFDDVAAQMARSAMPPVDLVVARHVFCHIDNWLGFFQSLDVLCQRETRVLIEVPWVGDLLSGVEFDTIYHEHLSYLNLRALDVRLRHTPFRLHRVTHYPIHGGSLVLLLCRRDATGSAHESVHRFLLAENITPADWQRFATRATERIRGLQNLVHQLNEEGRTVAGYGASAKGTVWMNAAHFTRKEIAFVCDSTPQKQYRTVPGTDIPVVDEHALLRERPDYAVCFAWNWKTDVLKKQAAWHDQGGRFIFPAPNLEFA